MKVNKRIIVIGLIMFLVIVGVFIIAHMLLQKKETHKSKYEIALEQLMKIDEIDTSMISTKKKSFKYNNSTITYNVSDNVEESGQKHLYNLWNNNNQITVFITPFIPDDPNATITSEDLKDYKKFTVNGREFIIGETTSSEFIFIITKIKDNSYCAIHIINEKIQLDENDLKNIKPFFEMTIK